MSRPKQAYGAVLAVTAIRIPPHVKAKLEALSHQSGLAQQEHIRRAIDNYFEMLVSKGQFDPHDKRPANLPRRGRPPGSVNKPKPQPPVQTAMPYRRIFRRPGSGASA